MDDADEPARGRSLELAHEPDVASELLVEKLKLLRYERDFLATRRPAWPPVTRHAFLSPSGNGGEQFHRFTSLAAFLARLAGDATHRAPEQFDDPNVDGKSDDTDKAPPLWIPVDDTNTIYAHFASTSPPNSFQVQLLGSGADLHRLKGPPFEELAP